MSATISNSFSSQALPTLHSPSVSSSAETRSPETKEPADTVKLSQSAHIHLLKQQGQTASQIAANLSIPVATVDGYLGIAVSKSSAPAPSPQAPSPKAKSQSDESDAKAASATTPSAKPTATAPGQLSPQPTKG